MKQSTVLRAALAVLAALALAAGNADTMTIHVPDDYPKVQGAIDAASSGDTVLVAAGTYAPSTNGEALPLNMKDGVRLIGAGSAVCVLDAESTDAVIVCSGTGDTATRIEGFTITNGHAQNGGGIYCYGSCPTIANNVIVRNSAGTNGGGIYCNYSSPTITNNTIAENSAYSRYGGGIFCDYESDPTITDNLVTENSAGHHGGGIACYYHTSPTITNNVITYNDVAEYGGGIMCFSWSSPTITSNVISGNDAVLSGGGIQCHGECSPPITNNVITMNSAGLYAGGIACYSYSSPTITNNTIAGNCAGADGGGIHCHDYCSPLIGTNAISGNQAGDSGGGIFYSNSCDPFVIDNIIAENSAGYNGGGICSEYWCCGTITNNTITGNSADHIGGGVFCSCESNPSITNNIISTNTAEEGGGGIDSRASFPTITYDDVCGNTPLDYYGCEPGVGCASEDPLFVDPSAGDYHLQPGSPCTDTGDNNAPGLPEFDFDGNPRVLDGDGDGDAVVDMGAFEVLVPPVFAVSGTVTSPDGGLLGVPVELVNAEEQLFGSTATDDAGCYSFEEVPNGDYAVSIVTPLGYTADDETKQITVAGDDVVCDFYLEPLQTVADPRSAGFWKHQLKVYLTGHGNAQIPVEDFLNYLALIGQHFNNNPVNPVALYTVDPGATQLDSLEAAYALLDTKGHVPMSHLAGRQLMALLLNVASDMLPQFTLVSADGATASQAITYCWLLIDDGIPLNDEKAKDIGDQINNGILVPPGVIPISTDDISYGQPGGASAVPATFVLCQNHPNPVRPVTTIRYGLAEDCLVVLTVQNILGETVARLVNEPKDRGYHAVALDVVGWPSGIYLYRLDAGAWSAVRKLTVVK